MSTDDTTTLGDAMGEAPSTGHDDEEPDELASSGEENRSGDPQSDAPVRASEIDWLALWRGAGFGDDARASTTQMRLAVELSDETAIRDHGAAVDICADAREQGELVGRQIGGCVVEWWIAPHHVESSE